MNMRRVVSTISATLLVALFIVGFPSSLNATLATSSTYDLSRIKISVSANHALRFKTTTGVDASTDTIVVNYPSGFSLVAIGVGDIDFFHGVSTGLETSETLAAAAAAGVWGVSIGASSITFTAPTDAGPGEIAANEFITIRIGTNASGGSGQIANPSSAQVANISINGTFGDFASIGVPIVTEDTVTVSATIGAAPPSGGGGGGGSGDTVAPQIFNVQVINITTSTATIVWDTNESAKSSVDYGITTAYANGTLSNGEFKTHHVFDLTGLSSGTTYHFQVSSRDAASNLATAGDFTFTTLSADAAPVISNVQVVDITDTSARVVWNTDMPADSRVDYGLTNQYGSFKYVAGFVTAHSVTLTALSPNTLYHFSVTSKNQAQLSASSTDGTFKTLSDSTPPANLMNFQAVGGDGVVHLTWNNPTDPDFAGVRIVRRTDGFPTGPFDGVLIYSGSGVSKDDTQVTNGITYYYGAYAFDTNSNFASGALAAAKPEGTAPGVENTPQLCANGNDDDADGKIDCMDSDCSAVPSCAPPPPEPKPEPKPVPTPIPVPEPTPGPGGKIIVFEARYYGAGGLVELVPDSSSRIHVLTGDSVQVVVPLSGINAEIKNAFLLGPSTYQLSLNDEGTAYVATFIAPAPGSYSLAVVLNFVGGGTSVANTILISESRGKIVEETFFGKTDNPIDKAIVTLFVDDDGWKKWNGGQFGQANPMVTGPDGSFGFVVPDGRYYAEVEKEGYKKVVTAPEIIQNEVYAEVIGMIAIPPLPEEAISPEESAISNLINIAKNAIDQAIFGLTVLISTLRSPGVQAAVENIVSPAVLAVAAINVAAALPAFNAFAYLQYLFSQPLLLFRRRKKKKWGIVYNTLTKQPIDLVIVRLLHAETRLVVQSKVTDKLGRYSFIVKPGTYLIDVVKPGYVYPTQYVKGKTEDVDYLDLYHAAPITFKEGGIIAKNIPIDPVEPVETPRQVFWKKTFRIIQQDVAFLTVLISIATLVIMPSLQVALITLSQAGIYLLFRRLSVKTKAKEWGIVYDEVTRQPIPQVVVRIFDKKFNKLLETQVTDANGKYGFFVRRSVYYVTAEKEGFEKFTSPDIDLSTKDEAIVDQALALKRKGIPPLQ
jgi:hypothetical protein